MKRFILILVFVVLAFSACKISAPDNDSATTAATTTEAISTVRTTVWRTNPDTGLQEYVPGNVQLSPEHDYFEGCESSDEKCSYRRIYYVIPGTFVDYYGERAGAFSESYYSKASETEINEIAILSLIRYFDMPKETFIELNNQEASLNALLAEYLDEEQMEVYNPDIIYTFYNDIINEFYRRE